MDWVTLNIATVLPKNKFYELLNLQNFIALLPIRNLTVMTTIGQQISYKAKQRIFKFFNNINWRLNYNLSFGHKRFFISGQEIKEALFILIYCKLPISFIPSKPSSIHRSHRELNICCKFEPMNVMLFHFTKVFSVSLKTSLLPVSRIWFMLSFNIWSVIFCEQE